MMLIGFPVSSLSNRNLRPFLLWSGLRVSHSFVSFFIIRFHWNNGVSIINQNIFSNAWNSILMLKRKTISFLFTFHFIIVFGGVKEERKDKENMNANYYYNEIRYT